MRDLALASSLVISMFALGCWATPSGRKVREIETADSVEQLQRHAGFDLQCPIAQTVVSKLDATSYGARGCGRQVRYVKQCAHCQWTQAGAVTAIVAE